MVLEGDDSPDLLDFVQSRLKLQNFVHRKTDLDDVNPTRTKNKDFLSNIVEVLLRKVLYDKGTSSRVNTDTFAGVFKDLNWYGQNRPWDAMDSIFTEIFVALALKYPPAAAVFLEILASAACNLNPPDKNHRILGLMLDAIAEIINTYSTAIEEDLLGRLDNVLLQELTKGLTFVPLLASGKVFVVFSIARVTLESKDRYCFATTLRKMLVSILSKTWQTQLFQRQITDLSPPTTENLLRILTEKKTPFTPFHGYNPKRRPPKANMLVEVGDSVEDLMYGNSERSDRKRMTHRMRADHAQVEVMRIHQEAMNLAPPHDENSSYRDAEVDVTGTPSKNIPKGAVDTWFLQELLEWKTTCHEESQLTSTVLVRLATWYSRQSSTRLFQLLEGSHANDLMESSFTNTVTDVTMWASDANQMIFRSLNISDIPSVIPHWTGLNTNLDSSSSMRDVVQKVASRYNVFITKFSMLKTLILCSSFETMSNMEVLLNYLACEIEKYFEASEDGNISFTSDKAGDFFSFISLFEFSIQLLSHLSPRVLSLGIIAKKLEQLCKIALALKRYIVKEDLKLCHGSEGSKEAVTIDLTDDAPSKGYLLQISVFALISMCSGIGYTLTQRFNTEESVSYLLCSIEWDASTDISSLFTSTPMAGNNPMYNLISRMLRKDNDDAGYSLMIAHPAISIVMNVFFMPHIGTEDCDKTMMKEQCRDCSRTGTNPSRDLGPLNLFTFLDSLPSLKVPLSHYFMPCDSSWQRGEHDERGKGHLLPNLRSLNRADFCRLTSRLASRFENGIKSDRRISHNSERRISAGSMDLSTFSRDVLVQVLSYLSFKRVCRMACVSSGIANASKEGTLWEILYKRKFRNFSFESCVLRTPGLSSTGIPECQECVINAGPRTSKRLKIRPCHYGNRRHHWMKLFQDRAIASRKILVMNCKTPKGVQLCPFVGCLFIVRDKEKRKIHDMQHLAIH